MIISTSPTNEESFSMNDTVLDSNVNLGIIEFWKTYKSEKTKELVIAVLDSCVDINHEDLKSHIWVNKNEIPDNGIDDDKNGYIDDYYGWNFYADTNKIYSESLEASHGTHCAGIIAAAHNGVGIMGILGNTNVKLMILPISGQEELSSCDLISAIKYADNMGAVLCNISGVFSDNKDKINEAVNDSNMYFVVAAGNFQNQYMNGLNLNEYERFPACCSNSRVITAGSTNENNEFSSFSNYSSFYLDVAAPGEYIFSTLPGNQYGYMEGTSMSVPIVTGILGAYYYCYADTVEEAADMLFLNSSVYMELKEKVHNGRIAKFVLSSD